MPNIFETTSRHGQRMAGTVHDHDELDYRATWERSRTEDPRLRYVPSLEFQSTDALLDVGTGKK